MKLLFDTQVVLLSEPVKTMSHISMDAWENLLSIYDQVSKVIAKAEENDHKYVEAISLKSLVSGLLGNSEEAITLITDEIIASAAVQTLFNTANNFQSIGDWLGLEKFLGKIPDTKRQQFQLFDYLALANQGRIDEAEEFLKDDQDQLAIHLELKSTGDSETPLTSISDFFVAAQIAVQRFIKTNRDIPKDYLLTFKPSSDYESLVQASSLLEVGCKEEALSIYRNVFERLGPGLGIHFANYLYLLYEYGERRKIITIRKGIPDKALRSYIPLFNFFTQFIHLTQGPRKALKFVGNSINDESEIWQKNKYLELLIQAEDIELAKGLVNSWGRVKGALSQRSRYLSLVSLVLGPDAVHEELYQLFHEYPKSIDVMRTCFDVLFIPALKGSNSADLSGPNEVCPGSAVVLETGESILIDDNVKSQNSPFYLRSNDEVVSDFLGKKKNEVVSYQGNNVAIREIISKYVWLARYAIEEQSKRPKTYSVHSISGGSPEEQIIKINENLKLATDQRRMVLKKLEENRIPMLTLLSGSDFNTIQEWLKTINENFGCEIPSPFIGASRINELFESCDTLIFDSTSIADLFIQSKFNFCDLGISKKLCVSSLLQAHIKYFESDFVNSGSSGSLLWDDDSRKAVYIEKALDSALSERTNKLISLLNSGELKVVDSIPGSDITGEALKIVNSLDPVTRDAIFASYDNRNTLYITDDPYVYEISEKIGVNVTSSLHLLYHVMMGNQESTAAENLFLDISNKNIKAPNLPLKVILFLMESKENLGHSKYYLKHQLSSASLTPENIDALVILAYSALKEPGKYLVFQEIIEFLVKEVLEPVNDKNEFVRKVYRSALSLNCPNKFRNRIVVEIAFILGIKIPLNLPYKTEIVLHHYISSLIG